jgi:molecular chaperone GrpE
MSSRKEDDRLLQQAPHSSVSESRFGMSRDEKVTVEMKEGTKGGHTEEHQQQRVFSMLSNLQQNLSSLLHLITNRLSYDKTKETAFDRLYQEMEELKQDQELNQLRPLYIDLILLIDRMNNIYKDKLDSGTVSPELIHILKTLSAELVEILYRRGVEPIYGTSNLFDPKMQQVVEVVPTSNSQEDGQIVEVVRHGFKYKDIILRPEDVIIKRFS